MTRLPDLADVTVWRYFDSYETYAFMADEKVLVIFRQSAENRDFLICNESLTPYGMWGFMNSGLEKWLPLQFPSLKAWYNHRNCMYCSMDEGDLTLLNLKAEQITRQQWLRQKGKIR